VTFIANFATRFPRVLLVAYCLALWLPGIFLIPPTDRDESRFVQATRQMLDSGDFVDIRNGTEARNRKPIGIYWLQAPGAALAREFGMGSKNPVWPYRLPSLLGALTGVLATFAIGRRMAGARAGLIAAAMLGGSVLLTTEATIAKTDAALLGATTLAMGVLARAYLREEAVGRRGAALFWLAMGAGILIKGPLTPMVAGLTAIALVIADRRAAWLGALRPSWGVPLMLAVVLPWFAAIGIATHGAFFHDAVGGDLAGKLAGGDDAHGAPPGYHLLLLSLTLFPTGALALCALPSAWRGRREQATRFLIAWIVPSWLVFEAVPTKLPHYTLPVFPALCLLAAGWVASPARWSPPRMFAGLAVALSVAAALVLGLAGVALPIVLTRAVSWLDLLGVPAFLAAALIAGILIRVQAPPRKAMAALAAMPLFTWSLLGFELPVATPLWVAPRVCQAVDAAPHPGGFAAAGYAEPSLMFLCGTETKLLPDGAAGARFLGGAPGRLVLVEGRADADFNATAAGLGVRPAAIAGFSGFNYSNGRRVELTLYEDR
jgi:4-amino-4-deoxy-L-arabinose transferase-like glycosyltransferase